MYKRFIPLLIFPFILGCSNSSSNDQEIIDETREEVIKLNQKYNKLFHYAVLEYMDGNSDFKAAPVVLQELFKDIMVVNKSLKIDCKVYNNNGEPEMVEMEDGSLHPSERLPDELRIEE